MSKVEMCVKFTLIFIWIFADKTRSQSRFSDMLVTTIVFNIALIDETDRMIERDITQTTKNSIIFATLWTIIIEYILSSQIRNRTNQWSLHLKSSSSTNKISRRIVVVLEEKSLFWLLSKLHSIKIWNLLKDVSDCYCIISNIIEITYRSKCKIDCANVSNNDRFWHASFTRSIRSFDFIRVHLSIFCHRIFQQFHSMTVMLIAVVNATFTEFQLLHRCDFYWELILVST